MISSSCVLAAVRAVRLASEPDAPGSGLWLWLGIGCVILTSVALGAAVSWLAWRDRAGLDHAEQAFRVLTHRAGLPSAQRARLRVLARATNQPPVALALSHTAFDEAARAVPADPQDHVLRRNLFADR